MDVIALFRMTGGLSTTRRYSQSRLHNEENVLEHTGFVVMVCNVVGREVNAIHSGYLDMGELLSKACMHDAEEFTTGDAPRMTKYYSQATKDAFDAVAQHGMNSILSEMKLRPTSSTKIYADWAHAKDGREGMIVKIADLMGVIWKMWSEILQMGNLSLMFSCQSVTDYLEELKAYIRAKVECNQIKAYLIRLVESLTVVAQMATEKFETGMGNKSLMI